MLQRNASKQGIRGFYWSWIAKISSCIPQTRFTSTLFYLSSSFFYSLSLERRVKELSINPLIFFSKMPPHPQVGRCSKTCHCFLLYEEVLSLYAVPREDDMKIVPTLWTCLAGLLPSNIPTFAGAKGAVVLLQCRRGCELSDIAGIKALRPCSERGHSASDRSAKFKILREILPCRDWEG